MKLGIWSLALLALGAPRIALASSGACIAAHAEGQVQRKAGKLFAAREQFASCAVAACPALIRNDCSAFEAELDAVQPHVTIVVDDGRGSALPAARVAIDGSVEVPIGKPVALDPGPHSIVASLPDGRSERADVALHEAEEAKVVVSLVNASAGTPPPKARPIPTMGYVLGGTALVALGSFTYFGLRGHGKQNDMDACAVTHSCAESEVHEMRQLYLAADLSLGVSLLSLGFGTYFILTRPERASEPARESRALSWSVVAAKGAACITASGRF